ncbi:MAG TPA: hypothetical protein VH025_06845 [Solirubrobacteraceae bacterium]|nr:hypothetical protein [Solirubrobacteraceae bacterium]
MSHAEFTRLLQQHEVASIESPAGFRTVNRTTLLLEAGPMLATALDERVRSHGGSVERIRIQRPATDGGDPSFPVRQHISAYVNAYVLPERLLEA